MQKRLRGGAVRRPLNLWFQLACVVRAALDDASRQLRFVDAASPRCANADYRQARSFGMGGRGAAQARNIRRCVRL